MRRLTLRSVLLGWAFLGAFAAPRPVGATVVVPVPFDGLAQAADVVVVGRVTRIASRWDERHAQLFTHVALGVDEVWKGDGVGDTLVLRQPGGRLPGMEAWVFGSPEFAHGEKVLAFLRRSPDGTLHVLHLYQGKFSIVVDQETGDELAYQPGVTGVQALQPSHRGPGLPPRRLGDLRNAVLSVSSRGEAGSPPPRGREVMAQEAEPVHEELQAAFSLLGPGRWAEPDGGLPVTMLTNAAGEPDAPQLGFDQVRAALAAWSSVPGSSFVYADGGFTGAGGFQLDGVSSISFRDPLGQIDPPSNCSGTLAIGGFFTNGETMQVNGVTFARIVEGDVVVADGWSPCGVFYQNYENLAEVLTHELGHVLGLGHSADLTATMAPYAHFDGRGAALADDDRAGVAFIYPGASDPVLEVRRGGSGAGSVTSDPGGIDCGSTCTATYPDGTVVRLIATPADGSVFDGWTGACLGLGECTVTVHGRQVVTAMFRELARLQFSTATYSASERGRSATITVTRMGGTTGTVGITYTADSGTGVPGLHYVPVTGVLTFPPGVTVRTFAVPVVNNSLADGPQTVALTLSAPTGGASLGTPVSAVLTILDDDVAGAVQFGSAAYRVNETGRAAKITVTRTGGRAGGVTVAYATSPGTAVPDLHYQNVAGVLTFGAGESKKTVVVPILNNTLADGSQTVTLTLSAPGGGATLGPQATAVLTIADDDAGGTVQFSAAAYTVARGAGAATITVTRARGRASGVTVAYATSPGTAVAGLDYQDVAGTVSFGPAETTKTFLVPLLNNTPGAGPRTVTLTLGTPGGGAVLGAQGTALLTIVE
jgi:hypothetical protein